LIDNVEKLCFHDARMLHATGKKQPALGWAAR
jgi:hypothetical protein